MALLDLDVMPLFAGLHPDGSILLELAIGDEDHLAKVTMPASPESRRLARESFLVLDLDDLVTVAPQLAFDIDGFVSAVRRRLIERAAGQA